LDNDSSAQRPSTGKNLSAQYLKPLIKNGWRVPNPSEAEMIAAWAQKQHRKERPFVCIMMVILAAIPLVPIIMVLNGTIEADRRLAIFILVGVIESMIFLPMLFFVRRRRKLLNGGYQLLDVIVTQVTPYDKEFNVWIKTAFGEETEVGVNRAVFDAIIQDALQRRGETTPSQDETPMNITDLDLAGLLLGFGKISEKGTRNIEVFPIVPVDEKPNAK